MCGAHFSWYCLSHISHIVYSIQTPNNVNQLAYTVVYFFTISCMNVVLNFTADNIAFTKPTDETNERNNQRKKREKEINNANLPIRPIAGNSSRHFSRCLVHCKLHTFFGRSMIDKWFRFCLKITFQTMAYMNADWDEDEDAVSTKTLEMAMAKSMSTIVGVYEPSSGGWRGGGIGDW